MPASMSLSEEEIENLRIGIREYIDLRVDGLEKLAELRFANLDLSLSVATTALEARLHGMNEWKAALSDQTQTFVTKTEYYINKDKTIEDIQMLREFRVTIDSKASQHALTVSSIVTGIAIVISILSFALTLAERLIK